MSRKHVSALFPTQLSLRMPFSFRARGCSTPEDILSDLSRDLDALAREHRVLDDMKDKLGVIFVDRAAEKVRRQTERAVELATNALRAAIGNAREELMDVLRRADQRDRQSASVVETRREVINDRPREVVTNRFLKHFFPAKLLVTSCRLQRLRPPLRPT